MMSENKKIFFYHMSEKMYFGGEFISEKVY